MFKVTDFPLLSSTDCSTEVTGLILAGGRATRMDGADKGLQILGGMPIIDHVLRKLAPQVDQVIISANRHIDVYLLSGCKIISDATPTFEGPLAGIRAGLIECTTPYLMCVPCDAPFIPPDMVTRLWHALKGSNAQLAVVDTGTPMRPRVEAVFCLMKVDVLPTLIRSMNTGNRSIIGWLNTIDPVAVHFTDTIAFCNINTQNDLDEWNLERFEECTRRMAINF